MIMRKIHDNPYQEPPFFAKGSISETGKTVEIINEDGQALTFHVEEALAIIEARLYAERLGPVQIGTREFELASTVL